MIKIYSLQSLNLYNAEEEAARAEISSLNRDKHRFIMAEAVKYVEANELMFTKVYDRLSGIETMEGKIDSNILISFLVFGSNFKVLTSSFLPIKMIACLLSNIFMLWNLY